jgi:hypothetical protein
MDEYGRWAKHDGMTAIAVAAGWRNCLKQSLAVIGH